MQPGIVPFGERHLEDEFFILFLDEQRTGRRTLAEHSINHKAVRETVAPLRLQGVGDDRFGRGGEFVLDFIEERQKILQLVRSGDVLAAVTMAQQVHGYSLTEAHEFVEKLKWEA